MQHNEQQFHQNEQHNEQQFQQNEQQNEQQLQRDEQLQHNQQLQQNEQQNMQQLHVIVVGGGYAGITCAEHLRAKDPLCKITLFSQEVFCSRPNLLFRFKFLGRAEHAIDYGLLQKDTFFQTLKINLIDSQTVVAVRWVSEPQGQSVVLTSTGDTIRFDKIVFATGGIPQFVMYPVTGNITDTVIPPSLQCTHFHMAKHCSPVISEYCQKSGEMIPKNCLVLRNVEEVRALYLLIRDMHESQQPHNILIIGSGTLAIDIVTHLLEGYMVKKDKEWGVDNSQFLPRVIILSRREDGLIGHSLLHELDACRLITERARKLPFSKFLEIRSGEVEKIIVHPDGSGAVCGVITKKQDFIACSAIVQALGVQSNVTLAKEAGLSLGPQGGILVNQYFECKAANPEDVIIPDNTAYAIGDCAELQFAPDSTLVWKNWTSAREQAIQCASFMADTSTRPEHNSGTLWFNQTLRMFDFYVACLGSYQQPATDEFLVRTSSQIDKYKKLVFKKVDHCNVKLIGALIIGLELNYYVLGTAILDWIRGDYSIPADWMDAMILDTFSFSILVKKHKHKEDISNVKDFLVLDVAPAISNKGVVGKKKFVNPLANKAKKATNVTKQMEQLKL